MQLLHLSEKEVSLCVTTFSASLTHYERVFQTLIETDNQ